MEQSIITTSSRGIMPARLTSINEWSKHLVRMSGTSMLPKFDNGDILACRRIDKITFFQWGEVYVINTRQGEFVQKVFPDKSNPDNILCVSENKANFPPFSLPKSEILSLSLVIGHAGM